MFATDETIAAAGVETRRRRKPASGLVRRACCSPDDSLTEQILDGFGPSSASEDPFDAVIRLFAMIDTLHRAGEPDLPDDPAIRSVEGWMFGPERELSLGLQTRKHAPSPKRRRGVRRARIQSGRPRSPKDKSL